MPKSAPRSTSSSAPPELVLYDGVCGLCHRLVRWLLRVDGRGRLLFAPLQGETAAPILARHPRLLGVDSVVFVRGAGGPRESVAVRSASVVAALATLGGAWRALAGLLWLVPAPLRNWGYDVVARRRYRWFGRFETCRLPTESETSRLLP